MFPMHEATEGALTLRPAGLSRWTIMTHAHEVPEVLALHGEREGKTR